MRSWDSDRRVWDVRNLLRWSPLIHPIIIYKGISVLGKGQFISFDIIQIGDKVDARFTGGRVVTVELLF